jgi:hypothetical protein
MLCLKAKVEVTTMEGIMPVTYNNSQVKTARAAKKAQKKAKGQNKIDAKPIASGMEKRQLSKRQKQEIKAIEKRTRKAQTQAKKEKTQRKQVICTMCSSKRNKRHMVLFQGDYCCKRHFSAEQMEQIVLDNQPKPKVEKVLSVDLTEERYWDQHLQDQLRKRLAKTFG